MASFEFGRFCQCCGLGWAFPALLALTPTLSQREREQKPAAPLARAPALALALRVRVRVQSRWHF